MSDEAGDTATDEPSESGRLSAEGEFMLIWGVAAALVTGLYALGGGRPTAVLLGAIATVASLAAVAADRSRPDFRPSTGLHSLIVISAAAGALIAYFDGGDLITASGLGVIAIANAGRVFEVGHRDEDSLLDPLDADESESDAEDGNGG